MWKIHKKIILSVFTSLVKAQSCTCSNCSDCVTKLNNVSCSIVELTADITNQAGNCIDNPANFSNKIFDCQGYTIDGDDSGSDYGIYLYNKSGNTIRNCVITDFNNGIYFYSSSNTLTNNTANSNNAAGIRLDSSSNNILTGNIANSNNVGIYLISSSNNSITGNTANENQLFGLQLVSSSNNVLTNNTANSNGWGGIVLSSSSYNNTINSNRFCSNNQAGGNYYDIHDWDSNSGDNNTCDTTANWDDDETTGCTYSCLDTAPPLITILSPINTTYSSTSIPLTFTVNEPTTWCGYSLDGTANKTIPSCTNTTLSVYSSGSHNVVVYANDTYGNEGFSNRVSFTRVSSSGGGGCGGPYWQGCRLK